MLAVGVPEIALAIPPASTKFPWLGENASTGASFTSVIASEKSTVIGELPDTPESKTLTVTA